MASLALSGVHVTVLDLSSDVGQWNKYLPDVPKKDAGVGHRWWFLPPELSVVPKRALASDSPDPLNDAAITAQHLCSLAGEPRVFPTAMRQTGYSLP